MLAKSQTNANIESIKLDKTVTSRKQINDCIKASTIVFKPKQKAWFINPPSIQ